MSFKNWQNEISEDIKATLNKLLPTHKFKEVVEYSVFPTGKLFRPLLVYSVAQDLGEIKTGHKLLAQSIELHHTYTLIHDDLPAMDNDDMRRGRASSHIKYSEWEAILAGDALLSSSFEIISGLSPSIISPILKLYGEYTGGKGLILGQIMDLGNENKTLESLLKLHELKTGKLIQLCLEGACLISDRPELQQPLSELGRSLGINFQLLDDLCEFTDEISPHELEINPFLHYDKAQILKIIKLNTITINSTCNELQLDTLKEYIQTYYDKIFNKLNLGISHVNKHVKISNDELKDLLK
ncbi:MAG: geranylgeranyl pyrophosphate synthase [Bacteriovoracaceae bacterium]|jgi:geranylgeranyl diphosphate synthase type II